jgi:hypothetical protein
VTGPATFTASRFTEGPDADAARPGEGEVHEADGIAPRAQVDERRAGDRPESGPGVERHGVRPRPAAHRQEADVNLARGDQGEGVIPAAQVNPGTPGEDQVAAAERQPVVAGTQPRPKGPDRAHQEDRLLGRVAVDRGAGVRRHGRAPAAQLEDDVIVPGIADQDERAGGQAGMHRGDRRRRPDFQVFKMQMRGKRP